MANTKQSRTDKKSTQSKAPMGDQQRSAQKLSGFSALSQQWDKR